MADSDHKRLPNSIFGALLLIATECMFFAGLLSAYFVSRSYVGVWPPVGQPRLPVLNTAGNTLILLLSACTLYMALQGKNAARWLGATVFLGSLFVILQGVEWVRLFQYGLTTVSSLYGAFFYLIVGAHGFHALIGLVLLSICLLGFWKRNGSVIFFYWFFIVLLWPFIYVLVYLL